ncbi:MAG: hypothetical protein OJF62_001307 [Pseudolabrys sp.]|jgi:hypothetical protein|nr:hypothetical protein [Pseudolabrys sp.]
MPWRCRRLVAGLLALACLVAATLVYAETRYALAVTAVKVDVQPIVAFDNRDPTRTRFGALEFRGGLVLTSYNNAFGGFSGLVVKPDGEHFVSVSDRGSWFRGRIVYRDGRPAAIADAELAPILDRSGEPLAKKGWFDSESLTESSDGAMYVGFERVQRIARFDFGRDGVAARGVPIPVPSDFKSLPYNRSLECLAAPGKDSRLGGSLIVITEHSLDSAGNFRSFILSLPSSDIRRDETEARRSAEREGESKTKVGRFAVKRIGDFDVSDCALDGRGRLFLLERSYSVMKGVGMRIRALSLADVKPGALLDGPVLIQADLGFQIDNMEGIGVHRNAAGETVLTLISDDNFSVLQRTLLLQFALAAE